MINEFHREAKLINLVGKNLEPVFTFTDSSMDFKNAPKREGSKLVYLTYQDTNNLNSIKIKDLAMNVFEANYYNKGGFTENGFELFEDWKCRGKNIDELFEFSKDSQEELKCFKFWNWHFPITKKYFLKGDHTVNVIKGAFDFGSLSFFGMGIYALSNPNLNQEAAFMGVGFMKGFCEFFRQVGKMHQKNELKKINKNIGYYLDFKENINNSKVEIIIPEKAKQIFKEAKASKTSGKYVKLDLDEINYDLKKAYGVAN